MSRLPDHHLQQVKALSKAMQDSTRAENTAPHHLRTLAREKEASAALLLKQHDTRCSRNPGSALTSETCALWEGHYALLEKARDLRRIADEAEADAAQLPSLNTATHRVTAGV